MDVYVESGFGGHIDDATQAWLFDLDHWGVCGQGADEASALADLAQRTGVDEVNVVERIHGDELAFARDREPATNAERHRTRAILDACRAETLALVTTASEDELDFDDPGRLLPSWAWWRTPRQLAWHLAETESRYYLPRLGLPSRPPADDLLDELRQSADHVRTAVATAPPALINTSDGQLWTTTKVLRRLAWHERSELVVLRTLLTKAPNAKRPQHGHQ